MKEHIDDDALQRAISKWEETVPINDAFSLGTLYRHLADEWGLMIAFRSFSLSESFVPDGKRVLSIPGTTNEFIVIDENKFLMFMLKFS